MAGERRKHVALIVETSISFGRGVLRGIARYLREHGAWSVFIEQRELGAALPDWIGEWDGHGIITRSDDPRIRAAAIPAVGLFDDVPKSSGMPMVLNDGRAVGRLAARHLLDRGFRRIAWYGEPKEFWAMLRRDGVLAEIADEGVELHELPVRRGGRRSNWEESQERLADWIASLERPLGLVACNDVHGLRALDACRRRGLAVPEEVAVIGADDDAELCELSDPPLSSVAFDPERVGYEAAALLDRMMAGKNVPPEPSFVAPRGVVTRHSTDVLAIDDPEIARALHFIRRYACDGINVASVVREVDISRRSLEQRFAALLGRTPMQEIHRIRIAAARELLTETDLPVATIAHRVGFAHLGRFGTAFKRATGTTPSEFRSGTS